jgi:hypothetical protein
MVFRQLMNYVTVAISYAPGASAPSTSSASPSAPQRGAPLQQTSSSSGTTAVALVALPGRRFHPLANKAMELAVRFLEAAPPAVVAQVFEELISVSPSFVTCMLWVHART